MQHLSELLYLLCLVAVAALILDSARPRSSFMPPARFFERLTGDRAARVTLWLFWWWIGWHFLFAETVAG